jgi:signal transduction histidine kinase
VVDDLGGADETRIELDGGLVVLADVDHASRMVRNLLENARHHGEAPVVVSARRTDDHVELRVRDHGPGVPEDFGPRLFQRFARSDEAKGGRAAHGTGLGLSIVRGLARAADGDAWYEPESLGACFVVSFPAAPPQEPACH